MQDMSSFTISAAIGMWRCGAKNIDIAMELNLCEWEVEELIKLHKVKLKYDIFKKNEEEFYNQDGKDNPIV